MDKEFSKTSHPIFRIFNNRGGLYLILYYIENPDTSLFRAIWVQLRTFILRGAVVGNLPLWFFIALVASRINFTIIQICQKSSDKRMKYLGIAIYLILFLIPFIVKVSPLFPTWINYICMASVFFGLGHYLKKVKLNFIIFLLLTIVYVTLMSIYPTWFDMAVSKLKCGNMYAWYPQAIIAILIINYFGEKLFNYDNLFARLGRNTLPLFCLHWPIIILMTILFHRECTSPLNYLIILIIGECILLPITIIGLKKSKFKFLIQ